MYRLCQYGTSHTIYYHMTSESVIKPCIKNDDPLVD